MILSCYSATSTPRLQQIYMDVSRLLAGNHSIPLQMTMGVRLVDFCAADRLSIGGTLFQHKNIHKGTWRSPNGLTVNQIDHICISSRFQHSLIDVKVCRGADIGADLVRGRLKIKLKSVAKINANKNHMPAIERLRNLTKIKEYNVALKN